MSDYIPKDPLGPNDPRGYDRYGNTRFEPADDTGKGPYILLGLLVAIGLIGGLLYFNGAPKDGENVAQAPNRPAIERTMPGAGPGAATTTPAIPAPATPAPATPAPAAPSDIGKQ
ncbi:MAG: hypothetical protein J0J01_10680 [Reyranella sp.]|uniref:hypothetical protein n=1 Tax=Reyranella sp. TaxID=1929291 RepID=UPI001AD5BFE2|nr:hypothetical protein [Reyranella sp.]MBN9087361.1 hypothetical protein [Reyranella sp.]